MANEIVCYLRQIHKSLLQIKIKHFSSFSVTYKHTHIYIHKNTAHTIHNQDLIKQNSQKHTCTQPYTPASKLTNTNTHSNLHKQQLTQKIQTYTQMHTHKNTIQNYLHFTIQLSNKHFKTFSSAPMKYSCSWFICSSVWHHMALSHRNRAL